MDTNTLDKLTYGLFVLSSKKKDKTSGCIIDACMQVGFDPDQIMISVMNSNNTRKIIEKSGVFCIAILDEHCPFELIKHFGYQSSRDVDKFEGLTTFTDINGVPCILSYTCGSISVKVTDMIDIGSHTIFIGKIKDKKCLSKNAPMTYSYYREHVMPGHPDNNGLESNPDFLKDINADDGNKSKCTKGDDKDSCHITKDSKEADQNSNHVNSDSKETNKINQKIIGWKCTICGSVYSDSVLPNDYMCSVCGHPSSDFVPIYE